MEIQLSKKGWKHKGLIAIIDDEDFDRVNKHSWSADNHKHTFYAVARINNKKVYLHNFLSGFKQTDHVDRNGLNNKRINLRECTRQQNEMNKPKRKGVTSSRFRGVQYEKRRNHWIASLGAKPNRIYLGSYKTEVEAAIAYNNKAKELFPEFAVLNIINN